jgi:hypothetical protein
MRAYANNPKTFGKQRRVNTLAETKAIKSARRTATIRAAFSPHLQCSALPITAELNRGAACMIPKLVPPLAHLDVRLIATKCILAS